MAPESKDGLVRAHAPTRVLGSDDASENSGHAVRVGCAIDNGTQTDEALRRYHGALSVWQYPASTASTFLSAIVGATAALTGFVVTVTVLVIQMATGTFSARILRLLYRDRMLKATLAVLVGTFTYSFAVLQRIEEDFVPDLGVTLAGFFISLSLLVFIVFFDRFIRQLKPVAVAAYVARAAFHA